MRRTILLLMLFIVLIGLSACGNDAVQLNDLEADGDIAAPVESTTQEEIEAEAEVVGEETEKATPEEIRELLNSIPYSGIDLRMFNAHHLPIALDETRIRIADFIRGINGFWGPPSTSFHSPEEAPANFVFWASFWATYWLQWSDSDSDGALKYHPELSLLIPYLQLGTDTVKLHKHIEETANELFYQKLEIQPPISALFNIYEFSGVYAYSLGIFGISMAHVPIILSYENILGDEYMVTCVFILVSGDIYYDENEAEIPEDELIDYLLTVPGRHTIILKNNPNGGFFYWAHILPE